MADVKAILRDVRDRDRLTFWGWCSVLWGILIDGIFGGALFRREKH